MVAVHVMEQAGSHRNLFQIKLVCFLGARKLLAVSAVSVIINNCELVYLLTITNFART